MTDARPRPSAGKPWWDRLPHETNYRDTGCRLHPSCLRCPLPRCAEDTPRGKQLLRRAHITALINTLLVQGYTQAEIAQLLGVSDRTVRRYKDGSRSHPLQKKPPERPSLSQRRNTR